MKKEPFYKSIIKVIVGIIIIPTLYLRYSFIYFVPILLTDIETSDLLAYWVFYSFIFVCVMQIFGGMKYWAKMIHYLFGINYEIVGYWDRDIMHSHSIWTYPTLNINGKEYNLTFVRMGAKYYDLDVNISRSVVFCYFFR